MEHASASPVAATKSDVVDFTTMFTFFTVEFERAATTLRESRVGNSKHPTLRHP